MKKIITIAALVVTGFVYGQNQTPTRCGTDFLSDHFLTTPELRSKYFEGREIQAQIAAGEYLRKKTEQVYTIPVVFHVVYKDSADNISEAQIKDGLAVLNEDFRHLNADSINTRSLFKPLAADIRVEFKLAQTDPEGNPTNGITRTQNDISMAASSYVRTIEPWPNKRYFNIWIVRNISNAGNEPGTTTLGYAFLPFPGQTGDYDGMVIRHDQVGRIGTALNSPYANSSEQKGRTMTHETGHYLGLSHTFQGGCNDPYSDGDGVDDTPATAGPNFQCNHNINTCFADSAGDLPDMIENYMDYAPGSCMNLFTEGQKALMRASFESGSLRGILVSQKNLENTGVLSTQEIALGNDFSVYPNPATEWFTVKALLSLKGNTLSLKDISGKPVHCWFIGEEVNSYSVNFADAHLRQGLYIMELRNEANQVSYRKLLIR